MKINYLVSISLVMLMLSCKQSKKETAIKETAINKLEINETKTDENLPYGEVDILDINTKIPNSVKPLFDTWVRDTYVMLAPDGYYYLTGTVKMPDRPTAFDSSPGIQLWRSKDLEQWEDMGIVFDLFKTQSWQKDYFIDTEGKKKLDLNGNPIKMKRRTVWASEIHYIKSQNNFFIVACAPENPNGKGSYVLKSTTGKPEGPYDNIEGNKNGPLTDAIDGSLFEDEDGTVYFVSHNHYIAKMKSDMSGLAEELKTIKETKYEREPYIEGAFMFKAYGNYHLVQAIWSYQLPDGRYTYNDEIGRVFENNKEKRQHIFSYDVVVASATSPYGPFGKRYTAVVGAGHNNFFQDKNGNWWCTMFGNPKGEIFKRDFIARPAIVPMKFENNQFKVKHNF